MKYWIRKTIMALGGNQLARSITSRIPRILMFHRFRSADEVDPQAMSIADLRRQLDYVRRHFVPVTIAQLLGEQESYADYPRKAVAITIDDGHESFLNVALPVFREFDVPATVFIVSDLVEREQWIWADKFNFVVERAREKRGDQQDVLNTQAVFEQLCRLPLDERDLGLAEFARTCGVEIPAQAPPKYRLMNWEQLRHLVALGTIDIGSHSCTHPIMSQLTQSQSEYEIAHSKAMIEQRLACPASSFCYPNGQAGDYEDYQLRQLEQAGYACGIASHFGYVTQHAKRYALPRINYVGNDLNLFAKYVDGIEYLQRKPQYDLA